jgi:hypothetical protein
VRERAHNDGDVKPQRIRDAAPSIAAPVVESHVPWPDDALGIVEFISPQQFAARFESRGDLVVVKRLCRR